MSDARIESLQHLLSLWRDIYSDSGKVNWSRMLPYYSDDIHFKDAVQEIRGKARFAAMTERLARRSRNLEFIIHNALQRDDLVFVNGNGHLLQRFCHRYG